MNTDRLKFAWARGAQFQMQNVGPAGIGGNWYDVEIATEDFDDLQDSYRMRVHPKDANFEYGPLSSALIDSTAGMPFDPVMYLSAESFIRWERVENNEVHVLDHDEMIMLKLFYAEYLADRGM